MHLKTAKKYFDFSQESADKLKELITDKAQLARLDTYKKKFLERYSLTSLEIQRANIASVKKPTENTQALIKLNIKR